MTTDCTQHAGLKDYLNPWNHDLTRESKLRLVGYIAFSAITIATGVLAILATCGINVAPLNALGGLGLAGGSLFIILGVFPFAVSVTWLVSKMLQPGEEAREREQPVEQYPPLVQLQATRNSESTIPPLPALELPEALFQLRQDELAPRREQQVQMHRDTFVRESKEVILHYIEQVEHPGQVVLAITLLKNHLTAYNATLDEGDTKIDLDVVLGEFAEQRGAALERMEREKPSFKEGIATLFQNESGALSLVHLEQIISYIQEQNDPELLDLVHDLEQLKRGWTKLRALIDSNGSIDQKSALLIEAAEVLPDSNSRLWSSYPLVKERMGLELTPLGLGFFSTYQFDAHSDEDRVLHAQINSAFELIARKLGCEQPQLTEMVMDTEQDAQLAYSAQMGEIQNLQQYH